MPIREYCKEWRGSPDVLILGAGFSCAVTSGHMPLMSNFFEGLDSGNYPTLAKVIKCLSPSVQPNVEELLLLLDQLEQAPTTIASTCSAEVTPECAKQAKLELERYCISRLCQKSAISMNWASALLFCCDQNTTVITMNYDNIAERLLSNRQGMNHHIVGTNCPHCKMRLILDSSCGCNIQAKVPPTRELWQGAILKLHGSVTWSRCLNEKCCRFNCLSPDLHCRPLADANCEECSSSLHPVIILPSVQKDLRRFREIDVMWQCAHQALAEAETVGIVGFSFPLSDALFKRLFQRGHEQKAYRRISVFDVNPVTVEDRVRTLLGEDDRITYDSFLVSRDGAADWFPQDGMSCKYPPPHCVPVMASPRWG